MRTGLAKEEDERKTFKAKFIRVGKKRNFKGFSEDTILLQQVMDVAENKLVADHVWFTYSKVFETSGMHEGDVITFDARIKRYAKGYVNKALGLKKRTTDFKLLELKKGKPNDLTDDEFKQIRSNAKAYWPNDFQMWLYEEQKQIEGLRKLRNS